MWEVGCCYCAYIQYCPNVQHNLNHSELRRLRWLLVVEMKAMRTLRLIRRNILWIFRRWAYRRNRNFVRVTFASANRFGSLGTTINAAAHCWCRRRVVRTRRATSKRMKKFFKKAVDKVELMDWLEKQVFRRLTLRLWTGWGLVSLRCGYAMLMSKAVAFVIRRAMSKTMKKFLEKIVVGKVERMKMGWQEK